MKPSPPITRLPPGRLIFRSFAVILFPLLILGCGNKKNEGIEAVFLADFSNAGVGDSDSYTDMFLDPNDSTLTVGVKSVKLIKAGDTDPSYTIFDTGNATRPMVLDLTPSDQSADINPVFPTECPCEFSKVQVELTYFDFQVPVFDNDTAIDRRFRFYTLDLTDPDLNVPIKAGEVLVGDNSDTPHFNWIDTANGSYVSISQPRPAVPLMVPESLFPGDSYTTTVTIDLPSFFKVSDKAKGVLTVHLTVHAGQLFFYDQTDTEAPANTRFDRFTDGRLNANEPDSHFYPTFPALTAGAE